MTLDRNTLEEAQVARSRFLESQHAVEIARVDYHHTIRRLHAAGGSLREIAEALGLSHQRVHQIVEPVEGADPSRGGPHHRAHRRLRGFVPVERFTDDARGIVATAIDEAAALGHRRVGTEHLLIGLAGVDGPAATALGGLGVTRDAVVAAVSERLGTSPAGGPGKRPFTPAARRVLVRAFQTTLKERAGDVSGGHILRVAADDGGDAADILAGLGVTAEDVREALA